MRPRRLLEEHGLRATITDATNDAPHASDAPAPLLEACWRVTTALALVGCADGGGAARNAGEETAPTSVAPSVTVVFVDDPHRLSGIQ